MRQCAFLVLLLLVVPAVTAAPAPMPKTQRGRPDPSHPYWEVDFKPYADAGQVNGAGFYLTVRGAGGQTVSGSVSQFGRAHVSSIVELLAQRFAPGDVKINPEKTHLTIEKVNGERVISVELRVTNMEQRCAPVVLPAGRRR
jgi:hypothetical protein